MADSLFVTIVQFKEVSGEAKSELPQAIGGTYCLRLSMTRYRTCCSSLISQEVCSLDRCVREAMKRHVL